MFARNPDTDICTVVMDGLTRTAQLLGLFANVQLFVTLMDVGELERSQTVFTLEWIGFYNIASGFWDTDVLAEILNTVQLGKYRSTTIACESV